VALFDTVDCCVTPVLNLDEALAHPQMRAREMSLTADGMTQYAPPFKISGWSFAVEKLAPAPGQHTDEILSELGYVAEQIASLRKLRIV
jgi:crotonobetainyl-CoA:carnitine CoA-transferase CaiB-like acyl-CoA transferase